MRVPGKNGFVNVLGALVGLSTVAGVESWARTMLDVKWVITQVLEGSASDK